MAGTFLERFVDRVLADLETRGEIELVDGSRTVVVGDVAGQLSKAGEGSQLIPVLTLALIRSEHIIELYVDDDELKRRIEELGTDWMR